MNSVCGTDWGRGNNGNLWAVLDGILRHSGNDYKRNHLLHILYNISIISTD